MIVKNDPNLRIDIPKTVDIIQKSFENVTAEDWKQVQKLQKKLSQSSSFSHKYHARSKDILNRK